MNYSFNDVCKYVKNDSADNPDIISAMDNIAGIAIIGAITGMAIAGQPVLPFGWFSAKNELTRLGKVIFNKISGKKEEDFLRHQERMCVSYSLISYTSFFEATDRLISDNLIQAIELRKKDKEYIIKSKLNNCVVTHEGKDKGVTKNNVSMRITFPHPIESYEDQKNRLKDIYGIMNKNLFKFIESSYIWDILTETEQDHMKKSIEMIPNEALKCFDAQYYELSCKCEDFCVWANLYEHYKTQSFLDKHSEYVRKIAETLANDNIQLDIGFNNLREVIQSIPAKLKAGRSEDIVKSLKKIYDDDIEEPVIKDSEKQSNDNNLVFPKIKDAFIPQSYKVIRKTDEVKELENENTWNGISSRDDIGTFIASFLSSPYSVEAPLIILGHPGSGKSVLTKVLASALFSERYTPIRIPLREVNASASIHSQIEEYINNKTYDRIDSWASFSSQFEDSPLVIILDGYDELLQASGKVFAGYLKDVKEFQKSLYSLKRPVRVIVTSRLTLIDKAIIPNGSTILRLLEFNFKQRERWISIWNDANYNYFQTSMPRVDQFKLPDDKEKNSSNILTLAKQPLLLLMLAIFDSDENKLKNSVDLDRAALYNSLLRRFIKREKLKDKINQNLDKEKLEEVIDEDMERLGATALGMYNRRKLYIVSKELNDDIAFFNQEKKAPEGTGEMLSQAEILLGSFFFVQKSEVIQKGNNSNQSYDNIAFEFLHNTFGEFLTAYFIVLKTFNEIEKLHEYNNSKKLKSEMFRILDSRDAFSDEWLACLIYTPLSSRVVIIQMIKEWKIHYLKSKGFSHNDFINQFDVILQNQIKRVLTEQNMPTIMNGSIGSNFGSHPLLGYMAIYSLNLIILHTAFSDDEFVFDEELIESYEDGTRPWDRLTYIWRSWFSVDNLNGLNTIFAAKREYLNKNSQVIIKPKNILLDAISINKLETVLNVSEALGDNITKCLASLLSYDCNFISNLKFDEIVKLCKYEKLDVELHITIKKLLKYIQKSPDFYNYDLGDLLSQALRLAYRGNKTDELRIIFALLQKYYVEFTPIVLERNGMHDDILNPMMMMDLTERFPQLTVDITLIFVLFNSQTLYDSSREYEEYFERLFHRLHIYHQAKIIIDLFRITRNNKFTKIFDNVVTRHFARIIRDREFNELIENEPKIFLELFIIARELKVSTNLYRIFVERLDNITYYLTKNMRNDDFPEILLEVLMIARDIRILHGEFQYYINYITESKNIKRLINYYPEIFLQLVEIEMDLGFQLESKMLFEKGVEIFIRFLRRNRMQNYNSEVFLQLLMIARKLGLINTYGYLFEEYFDNCLHHKRLQELMEYQPDVFLQLFKTAKELNYSKDFEIVVDKYFKRNLDRMTNIIEMERLINHEPKIISVLFDFVLESNNEQAFIKIRNSIEKYISSPYNMESFLNNATINILQKLKLLSIKFNDYNFQSMIESIL